MQTLRISLLLLSFLFSACSTPEGKKEWKIAVDPTWYPLDLMGRDKQLMGFVADLLQEISVEKKLKLALVRENWDNLLQNLNKKQYQAILSSLQPYTFYENKYDFSEPFLLIGPVLVMPANSKTTSLDDLSGKEIAVLTGSTEDLILEKYPDIIIRYYGSVPSMLDDILTGQIDGALLGVLEANAYTQDLYQGNLKIATPPLNDRGLRLIALHSEAPALIEAFNSALDHLKKTGKYTELARKWGLAI